MTLARQAAAIGAVAALAIVASRPLDAHKPITSQYTFAEDVAPILRERCAACHVAGGVGPMPLTTAEDTVPWGESIRLELVAGHMPPWAALSNASRLRRSDGLTARELNVLLTWVTGGTPPGDKAVPSGPVASPDWTLGTPDHSLELPETTLAMDQGELSREFVLPLDAATRRPLRAVDLRPGTRSLVRSATIRVRAEGGAADAERMLAAWVPGDEAAAVPSGGAFDVPDGAELVVRVRYKKTWQHEREVMTDRSTIGLYFATANPVALRARPFGLRDETLDAAARGVALYPTAEAAGRSLTVDAFLPSGVRQRVIAFTPRAGWERRYWFDQPLDWPAGTRLRIAQVPDPESAAPASPTEPLLVLNTLPAR